MRGQGKEESGQEVTHFGGGDGKKGLWGFSLLWGSIGRKMTLVLHANTNKEGIGEQDKCNVTIPSDEASDLILVKSEVFGRFQVLLDVPPRPNGRNHLLQRGSWRGKDQIIRLFVWIIGAATDQEPVTYPTTP